MIAVLQSEIAREKFPKGRQSAGGAMVVHAETGKLYVWEEFVRE